MLFLVGFPPSIHADIVKDVVKATPGEFVAGLPAPGRGGYNAHYLSDCMESLVAFHAGRKTCFDKGLVVIAFRDASDVGIGKFADSLYPFAIIKEVAFARKVASSGKQLSVDKNDVSRAVVATAKTAIRVRNQVTGYLSSRCNRTPLLLPRRHFNESALETLIREVWEGLQRSNEANSILENSVRNFERRFPFVKGKKVSGHFTNSNSVEFRSPGRDLHGLAYPKIEGHQDQCFLNGSLRIGGQIRPGFHFDCTHKGGRHGGAFPDCHGETVNKKGNPHLNVFPNDYIR